MRRVFYSRPSANEHRVRSLGRLTVLTNSKINGDEERLDGVAHFPLENESTI